MLCITTAYNYVAAGVLNSYIKLYNSGPLSQLLNQPFRLVLVRPSLPIHSITGTRKSLIQTLTWLFLKSLSISRFTAFFLRSSLLS